VIWIGDVHGHYEHLQKLLKKLPKGAEIGFLGDIIDRGPKPFKCLKLAFDVSDNVLLGNHEELMFLSLKSDSRGLKAAYIWDSNGGSHLIDKINKKPKTIYTILDFLPRFKTYVETENSFACHAGINFSLPKNCSKQKFIEIVDKHDKLVRDNIDRKIDNPTPCPNSPSRTGANHRLQAVG